MLEINGVELEFDVLDADTAECYEAAMSALYEEIEALEIKSMSNAEVMRRECHIVFACFDAIFGTGTSQAIFGEKTNLGVCTAALEQLVNSAEAQQNAFNERLNKYRPNRAARRAKV